MKTTIIVTAPAPQYALNSILTLAGAISAQAPHECESDRRKDGTYRITFKTKGGASQAMRLACRELNADGKQCTHYNDYSGIFYDAASAKFEEG